MADQPILNTKLGMSGIGNFISDLILAVFSLMAEIERNLINKRMKDGLKRIKLQGKKLGRRCKPIPAAFWHIKMLYQNGEISQGSASRDLDIDQKTFKSWIAITGDACCAREWEEMLKTIGVREREERIKKAQVEYGVNRETLEVQKSFKEHLNAFFELKDKEGLDERVENTGEILQSALIG